ncbi:MAG: AMP-binding protein [Actinobacteria bacterium]|nr:AMP-binding protein [Actinomycetota bacterium]
MTTPRLVALDATADAAFPTRLMRIWEAGDAALPVDPRLSARGREELCRAMRVGEPVAEGDALVVATSGSTGAPKGVVLTHSGLAAKARAVHERLGVDRRVDSWCACLPLAHVGGLGVVVRCLVDDVPLQMRSGFDPDAVNTTLVSLVPTVLDRLDPDVVARFRWIVLGGSSDPASRPGNVLRTWGMTESGGGVVYGDRPLDGVEVRVVDGELQLRSPSMLRCYRDGTDPKDPEGWYATGDLGAIDAEGRVSVTGRRDQMIVTGGENVWPEAVEAILRDAPGVADVAVTGRSDPEWGQRVVAVVVPTDPAAPPSLEALRSAVGDALARYAAPREVELVTSIPRTALGKIRRGEL